jgi:quercetin 2,3-dioxygenase
MTLTLRRSHERGHADHGWLDTYHSFSFADYHDPRHMGFRSLRVINEDRVAAGEGFGTHPHRDMEIITVVTEGALEHKDSLGTGSVLRPGDVQRMTAGTGIQHSEFNHSKTDALRLFQVWILPERRGLTPGYEEKRFAPEERKDRLRLVASRDARDGALTIHQDVDVFVADLGAGVSVAHELAAGRHAWLQLGRGRVTVNGAENGAELRAGDGVAVSDVRRLEVVALEPSELLLFDLA